MQQTNATIDQRLKDEIEKIKSDAASGNITGHNRTHRILVHHHQTIAELANQGLSLAAAHRAFCKGVTEISYNSMNNYVKQWLPDIHRQFKGLPPLKKETKPSAPEMNKPQAAMLDTIRRMEEKLGENALARQVLSSLAMSLDERTLYKEGIVGILKELDTVSGRLLLAAADLCDTLKIDRHKLVLTQKVVSKLYANQYHGDLIVSFDQEDNDDWISILIWDCSSPRQYIEDLVIALNEYHAEDNDKEEILLYMLNEARAAAIRHECSARIFPSTKISKQDIAARVHIDIRDCAETLHKTAWIKVFLDNAGSKEGYPTSILAWLIENETERKNENRDGHQQIPQ